MSGTEKLSGNRRGQAAKGAHAVLLLDRAGWHTTTTLDVPGNITPILPPPERLSSQCLRAGWLSNRVFENHHEIIEAICDVWQGLIARPETITSIGM